MRQNKFLHVSPNYHRRTLDVVILRSKKKMAYSLPFAVLKNLRISRENPFTSLKVDKELGSESVSFVLKNGQRGDFHADLVLYYCDPDYEWSPLNQVRATLKEALESSRISIRVLADLLDTSPSQVVRLLEETKMPRQLLQLERLASIAGYSLKVELKKAP